MQVQPLRIRKITRKVVTVSPHILQVVPEWTQLF